MALNPVKPCDRGVFRAFYSLLIQEQKRASAPAQSCARENLAPFFALAAVTTLPQSPQPLPQDSLRAAATYPRRSSA